MEGAGLNSSVRGARLWSRGRSRLECGQGCAGPARSGCSAAAAAGSPHLPNRPAPTSRGSHGSAGQPKAPQDVTACPGSHTPLPGYDLCPGTGRTGRTTMLGGCNKVRTKYLGLLLSSKNSNFKSIMPFRANLKLLHTRIWISDYLKVSTQ